MKTQEKSDLFSVLGRHGYMIVGFTVPDDAQKARRELIDDGDAEESILIYSSEQVVAQIEKHLNRKSLFEQLGYGFEFEALEQYLELAHQGVTFMLVSAPTSHDVQHVVDVANRYPVSMIRRYGIFVIDDIEHA